MSVCQGRLQDPLLVFDLPMFLGEADLRTDFRTLVCSATSLPVLVTRPRSTMTVIQALVTPIA